MAQQQSLMNELHAMKEMIEDRFNTMAWLGQAKQNPSSQPDAEDDSRRLLARPGARAVLERLPEDLSAGDSVRWLMEVLERNLKTDEHDVPLYEQGGIFALVGSTGVGKTTTTAKLAALCARVHGPGSVGLITLDTYRVGAHEQLRTYGRMLGIVAHLAHDRRAARPAGSAQRQEDGVDRHHRRGTARPPQAQHAGRAGPAPCEPPAGAQCRLPRRHAGRCADLVQDRGLAANHLVEGGRSREARPSIDALIRHQMVLRGVTNGQRVPEDWEAAEAHKLISASMRAPVKSAFDPKSVELNYYFSNALRP